MRQPGADVLTIVIYFDGAGRLDPPLDDPMYLQSYRAFVEFSRDQGGRVVIARRNSYLGQMRFRNCWEFVSDDLVEIANPVSVDVIFVKGTQPSFILKAGELAVNALAFLATNDKWTMHQVFPNLMPPTYLITDENWREVLAQIPTDEVVLKPRTSSGGKGIVIAEKATLDLPSLDLDTDYVAQPFIDSSAGIPGLCNGFHDLRILMFNAEPKLAFLRLPQPGKLLSNVSQGASVRPVPIERVPATILDMARAVDREYRRYSPRHYSADFFQGPDRPYLIETNTQPGFPTFNAEGEAFQLRYYQYLWQLLRDASEEHAHAK